MSNKANAPKSLRTGDKRGKLSAMITAIKPEAAAHAARTIGKREGVNFVIDQREHANSYATVYRTLLTKSEAFVTGFAEGAELEYDRWLTDAKRAAKPTHKAIALVGADDSDAGEVGAKYTARTVYNRRDELRAVVRCATAMRKADMTEAFAAAGTFADLAFAPLMATVRNVTSILSNGTTGESAVTMVKQARDRAKAKPNAMGKARTDSVKQHLRYASIVELQRIASECSKLIAKREAEISKHEQTEAAKRVTAKAKDMAKPGRSPMVNATVPVRRAA